MTKLVAKLVTKIKLFWYNNNVERGAKRLKRENENVEFKKSSGKANDAMKTVCGMLNKFGEGTIFFGVKNDGTVRTKVNNYSLLFNL